MRKSPGNVLSYFPCAPKMAKAFKIKIVCYKEQKSQKSFTLVPWAATISKSPIIKMGVTMYNNPPKWRNAPKLKRYITKRKAPE
jgi:hypothetical protein